MLKLPPSPLKPACLLALCLVLPTLAQGVAPLPNAGDSKPPAPDSVLPDSPKSPTAAPREAAQLELLSLRVGRSPVKQLTGLGGSFITNTGESLDITAEARVKGRPELAEAISWHLSAPTGFVPEANAQLSGTKLTLRLARNGGNPSGAGGYLALTVGAKVEVDGRALRRSVLLTQDARDRLRQEYVDLERREVPDRDELIDEGEFYRRFGRRYQSVSFEELNTSRNPATGQKYPAIPLAEELVRTVHRAEKAYGRPVQVTSGFRNPVRQLEVHAEVEQSHHQYGRAADLYVPPGTFRGGKRIASEADWLRLASAALEAGGSWIEPMLACHPNTDQCHVHVDVRPGPPQSRVLTVRGRVTDPSGNPVPGATVRLAGMPAVANDQGDYQLKHVVSSPEEEISIEAPGRGTVTRSLVLAENPVLATLTMPADPQPSLLPRLEPGTRDGSGKAVLRLVLKNIGLSEARGVRLSAGMAGNSLRLGPVLPSELAAVPAGAEGSFNIEVTAAPGSVALARTESPLQVTANFLTPSGQPRTQTWSLAAQVEPAPVTVPLPAAVTMPRKLGVIQSPGHGGLDLGAAFAGLLLGALAGAASIALRPRHLLVAVDGSQPEAQTGATLALVEPIPESIAERSLAEPPGPPASTPPGELTA